MTIARHARDARVSLPAGAPGSVAAASRDANRRAAALFWILTAGAAGMAALLALLPAAGHDQLWFLLMARRWLHGAALYGPEAFDSNPPAVVWLSGVPVQLGEWLRVPATLPGKVLTVLLGSACAWLALPFLERAWRPLRNYERPALLFVLVVLFGVVPARDFGQRDHLASWLLLPYVLAACVGFPDVRAYGPRLLAAVFGGIAICLKPHYALIPLSVEAALLFFPALRGTPLRQRDKPGDRVRHLLRPEPVTLVLLGGAYLLAVQRWAPLYFRSALPITRSVYWAIGGLSFPRLLWEAVELCVLASLPCVLLLRQRHTPPAVRLLLVAGWASFAAYLVQGTGWYYQQLPAIGFFGAALALQLLDAAAKRPFTVPRWALPATAALVVLALALTTHFTGDPFTPDRAFAIDSPDPALFRDLKPGTPVAILTTSVDEAMMPVERFHLTWAQRTNNLWLLPAILRSERPEGTPARRQLAPETVRTLDGLQHRWMVEDLQRWQPQLVLVERCQDEAVHCQVLEDRHDDLLAWFETDSAFRGVWQHYRKLRSDARFDTYKRAP